MQPPSLCNSTTFATPNIKASTQAINSYLFLIPVPYQPLRYFFSMGLFILDVAHSVYDLSASDFFHSAFFGSSSAWKHVPAVQINSFLSYIKEGTIHLSGDSTHHQHELAFTSHTSFHMALCLHFSWVESRVEFLRASTISPLLEELPSCSPLCFLAAVWLQRSEIVFPREGKGFSLVVYLNHLLFCIVFC